MDDINEIELLKDDSCHGRFLSLLVYKVTYIHCIILSLAIVWSHFYVSMFLSIQYWYITSNLPMFTFLQWNKNLDKRWQNDESPSRHPIWIGGIGEKKTRHRRWDRSFNQTPTRGPSANYASSYSERQWYEIADRIVGTVDSRSIWEWVNAQQTAKPHKNHRRTDGTTKTRCKLGVIKVLSHPNLIKQKLWRI